MKKVYYFGKAIGFLLMATGVIWAMLRDARHGFFIGLAGFFFNMITMAFRPNSPRLFMSKKSRNRDSAYDGFDIDAFWPRKRR